MKRLVWLGLILVAARGWAFDRGAFEMHLRKALSVDSRADIHVTGDPTPSSFGDLLVVPVTVAGNPYKVYMTKDEKQYLWGLLFDMTVDPDKDRASKISLTNVRSKGSAAAPVTVVEFSDHECSFCKKAHDEITKKLYETYKPTQVRLVFKHFPLQMHQWAEIGAVGTECAAAQRPAAFWDMSDRLFDNQEKINKDNVKDKLKGFAADLKLDGKAFAACLDSSAPMEKVQADKKEGVAAGVGSTPTIFVNGRMMRGFREFEDLKVLIEEKLAEAHPGAPTTK